MTSEGHITNIATINIFYCLFTACNIHTLRSCCIIYILRGIKIAVRTYLTKEAFPWHCNLIEINCKIMPTVTRWGPSPSYKYIIKTIYSMRTTTAEMVLTEPCMAPYYVKSSIVGASWYNKKNLPSPSSDVHEAIYYIAVQEKSTLRIYTNSTLVIIYVITDDEIRA